MNIACLRKGHESSGKVSAPLRPVPYEQVPLLVVQIRVPDRLLGKLPRENPRV